MRYFQPIHLDSDNRGCEAITKGTALLLKCQPENLISLSRNIELDKGFGYSDYCTLKERRKKTSLLYRIRNKVLYHIPINSWKRDCFFFKEAYNRFLDEMTEGDIMLSTGGDMMCYNDNEAVYTNNYAYERGVKTILWGCSFGEENITDRKIESLNKFSLIYARESLSEKVFKNLGLKNVVCFPDPAFVLEPEECELPQCFDNKRPVIGFNVSNYTLKNNNFNTSFGSDIICLFDKIIRETKAEILIIPHVLWAGQDDRIVSRFLYEKYKDTGRVTILDAESRNYCQIRYIISRLKMFFGARTHSVISAYSTNVPTVALGYSIKSKGIAKDIGLSENLVVNAKNYKKGSLIDAYEFVCSNGENIRLHMAEIMPEYKQRTYGIRKIIDKV